MAKALAGRRVAVLAADGVEQVDLVEPRRAVEDAGATTELLSIKEGEVRTVTDIKPAETFAVDRLVGDASPDDYDALILPGGVAHPDHLRADQRAVDFVQAFVNSGKPVGVLCHGPLALVEAGVMRGRRFTSSSSAHTGLPAFCREIVAEFAAGKHPAKEAQTK